MNNDDIKKFIDLSKLYTEVDLAENKKVEEGFFSDLIKGFFPNDKEKADAVDNIVNGLDKDTVDKLDTQAQANNQDNKTSTTDNKSQDDSGKDLGNGFNKIEYTMSGRTVPGILDTQSGNTFIINDGLVRSPAPFIVITKKGNINTTFEIGPDTTKAFGQAEIDIPAAPENKDSNSTDTGNNVEPRPTGSGVIQDYGKNEWDQKYGATHNADGTPKEVASTVGDDSDDDSTDIAASSPEEFKNMGDAQLNTDKVEKGDTVKIDGVDYTVDATEQGDKFYVDAQGNKTEPKDSPRDGGNPGGSTTAVEPKPDGSTDAVGSEEDPDAPADQEGGVAQGMDQADAAQGQDNNPNVGGGQEVDALKGPDNNPNTKDLMTRYNEGGKKAMPEIKKLQTELGRLGFDPNGIDGKYGNGTYKAVQEFQKANGLTVDGQAGADTLAALEKAIKGDQPDAEVDSAQTSNDAQAAQNKADADADSMTAKNQDIDIKTAQPNADLDRYIELLNKLEGGEKQAGAPNAELDAQQRGVAVAETDFRKLISIVEAKLLVEQLTDAEAAELEALHTKVQGYVGIPGMDDDKIQNALNRYLKLKAGPDGKYDGDDLGNAATTVANKGPDGQYDGDDLGNAKTKAPKVTLDTISAQIKKGITFDQLQKAVTDAEALEPEDAAKDANILKKLGAKAKQLLSTKDYRVKYVLAKGAETLGIDGLYHTNGKLFYFMKDGEPSAAAGGSLNSAMQVAQLGLLPPKKVEDFKKLAPNKPKFQALLDAHAKATGEGGAEAVASTNVAPSKELNLTATGTNNFNINRSQPFVDIMDGGKKTRVYGDPKLLQKRYPDQKVNQPTKESTTKDSTMKKAIKEASMNISINGDSAAEVAELAGILKNAGMDTHSHSDDMLPKAGEMPAMAMDPHDDMVSKMSMMDEPAPGDSGCGMEEEVDESEWDNSPEEAYADHQTMTHDLSGGINRRKPQGAIRVKDPAVALETSIRERLWAALNEKVTEGSRGKKKKTRGAMEDVKTNEGSRGKKKKSRGAMEDMTTEGSRGKKKKSRGAMEGSRGKTSRGKKSRG